MAHKSPRCLDIRALSCNLQCGSVDDLLTICLLRMVFTQNGIVSRPLAYVTRVESFSACHRLHRWGVVITHSIDVIMCAMACQIAGVSSVCSAVCSAQIKENIKAPCHWPLWGETSGHKTANNVENVSIWWRHHVMWSGQLHDNGTDKSTYW